VTVFLLDVNVLIALVDPAHVQHDAAHEWFDRVGAKAFATCPITETGLLRIVGNSRYPNSPGTPAAVVTLLAAIRALPGHHFWADTISPIDTKHLDPTRLLSHSQVTDSYLLALAHSHKGRLATLDRRLVVSAVHGGQPALELI
jgi:uncharacterized protein